MFSSLLPVLAFMLCSVLFTFQNVHSFCSFNSLMCYPVCCHLVTIDHLKEKVKVKLLMHRSVINADLQNSFIDRCLVFNLSIGCDFRLQHGQNKCWLTIIYLLQKPSAISEVLKLLLKAPTVLTTFFLFTKRSLPRLDIPPKTSYIHQQWRI